MCVNLFVMIGACEFVCRFNKCCMYDQSMFDCVAILYILYEHIKTNKCGT